MLKSKANWKFIDKKLAKEGLHTSSIIDNLLHERGICSDEEKDKFLHPKLDDIQSPKLLHQASVAKERIEEAIKNSEKITVYGDYDADGITSTAVMMKALKELGATCDYYIPNRFDEGYGLHENAIRQCFEAGTSLILTVDTGIANVSEVEYANELGIDIIITDHHEVQNEIPNALAIIHPLLSPDYHFKMLAGVGVAFQFAAFLLKKFPAHLLDLVAIGTIADLVPLIGENRVFAYYGIKQLATTEHLGLQALIKQCDINNRVSEREIGFIIAPRLNAVGRLQDAKLAVELLLTEDVEKATLMAKEIEHLNTKRQQIVNEMIKEAERRVNSRDHFIVLFDESWHEGVLGIAASRLVSKYDRPVMMLTLNKETNEYKGSARSIPSFNLFENGMEMRELFTKFGGHSQAAGMMFPVENLSKIKKTFNEKVAEQLDVHDLKEQLMISQSITLDKMTESVVSQIEKFAPFGMKNEEPLFHLQAIPSQIKQLGHDKSHLKFQFKHDDRVIDAIGFRLGHLYDHISPQVTVSLVGKLEINEWNGNRSVQMLIQDIAVSEWQLFDYRGKRSLSNILPFLHYYEQNILVGKNIEQIKENTHFDNLQLITYDSDISTLGKTDILFIYDLPDNLNDLSKVIIKTNPNCIHVSYHVTEDAFLQSIPSRDEFKWVYGFLVKHSPVHLKVDLPNMMQMKRWSKERLMFILKVFLDLQFISVKNNVITINQNAEKKELHQSETYQKRLAQSDIEKTLYYSTYEELKQWMVQHLEIKDTNREEIVHGL